MLDSFGDVSIPVLMVDIIVGIALIRMMTHALFRLINYLSHYRD